MTPPPRILTIAGSDSSGGAGIQADIKTITMLGGYAMTAITAITAQNTQGVTAVEVLSPELVVAQIEACASDIGINAVKIGMLGSPAIAHAVADLLESANVPVVFDPVMIATSGAALADAETIAAFDKLASLATLITPNTPELEALAGMEVRNEIQQSDAADAILTRTGCRALLAKGGHIELPGSTFGTDTDGNPFAFDDATQVFDYLYLRSEEGYWSECCWNSPRIATRHTHGTGCTLASAIATGLGMGLPLESAIRQAREFVRAALLATPGFGEGHGPLGHQAVR